MTTKKYFKPIEWQVEPCDLTRGGENLINLRCLDGAHVDLCITGSCTIFIFGIRLDEFKASISALAKSLRKPDLDNSLGVIQWCAYEGLTITKGNVLARFGTDKAHVQGLIDYSREFLRQVKEHKDAQAA
jgi:hypothetical protein